MGRLLVSCSLRVAQQVADVKPLIILTDAHEALTDALMDEGFAVERSTDEAYIIERAPLLVILFSSLRPPVRRDIRTAAEAHAIRVFDALDEEVGGIVREAKRASRTSLDDAIKAVEAAATEAAEAARARTSVPRVEVEPRDEEDQGIERAQLNSIADALTLLLRLDSEQVSGTLELGRDEYVLHRGRLEPAPSRAGEVLLDELERVGLLEPEQAASLESLARRSSRRLEAQLEKEGRATRAQIERLLTRATQRGARAVLDHRGPYQIRTRPPAPEPAPTVGLTRILVDILTRSGGAPKNERFRAAEGADLDRYEAAERSFLGLTRSHSVSEAQVMSGLSPAHCRALILVEGARGQGRPAPPHPAATVDLEALRTRLATADYFEVLSLPRSADTHAVETAWTHLRASLEDVPRGTQITDIIDQIDEARQILKDPGLRARYRSRLPTPRSDAYKE